ncbi:MAG: Crp/Fnr family transcriptional regulator [Gammaproteobacteria bacterium]|nr:MAG: Crp/Fnr family transcriptional regulator [Gammaproteobacteria bacterium]
MEEAQLVRLPPGMKVFEPGGRCQSYLLVVEGSVRVQLVTESGREAVLYHVRAGNSCILTTSCLLGGQHYPAEGVTESEVAALVVPAARFLPALDQSRAFRKFVFANLGRRLAEVMERIEQIAFGPIDRRLAGALLDLADGDGVIRTTHQNLAVELGSAREVISRHLKRFESRDWVALGRGTITIRNAEALQGLVDSV